MKNEQSRTETQRSNNSTGASEGTEEAVGGRASITGVTRRRSTRKIGLPSTPRQRARINVSINVGVALPHSVHLYPVPEDIVTIVPEYRGYEYILLEDNRVAIVDPDTFEVVDIIIVA